MAEPRPSAISARGLVKSYGQVVALRGVDLEVASGEVFGFLGPNGAGKTTTIRCMLDLIRRDRGELRVLGLDPRTRPEAVKADTGYLPGELHLYESMTAEATLRFLARLRGRRVEWPYVEELAERLRLDLGVAVGNLSRGNKQKIGLIQAFMHRPRLLLLDEPTTGVDPLVQQEVHGMIRSAQDQGATVFFSSHVISEVQEVAERVAIIRGGVVAEVATTRDLVTRAVRRLRVQMRHVVDGSPLGRIQGVTLMGPARGRVLQLEVTGDMDALIRALAYYPVSGLDSERPSLEEVFRSYFAGRGEGP